MPDAMRKLLFPVHMRNIPQRRLLLNIFRSLHILCFSLYLGGFFFNQPVMQLEGWFLGIIVSGMALFAIDLYSSCILLFEVRGVSVLLKLLLLFLLPLMQPQYQLWLLMLLVIFSSFISHSSRNIRHKNLLPLTWQKRFGIHKRVHSQGTA